MSVTAYVLTHPLTAQRPTRWDVQARHAFAWPQESLDLPAGTWLLELPANNGDRPHPPHYRLADGRVVALADPLTPEQAAPLTDPQALAALTAYRSLDQALYEEWGLQAEHVDRSPPFRLIQCPLCGDASFTTVGFAQVWCDTCHANFTVRYTAGDPGFVLDATFAQIQYNASRYLLPRSDELLLTMVFKNSGDPLDRRRHEYCHRDDCATEQVALTNGVEGPLRAGLHACALGDVYDWQFSGYAPAVYRHEQHGCHDLLWPDGRREAWPQTAFLPVSGLGWEEKMRLEEAVSLLAGMSPPNERSAANWRRYRDERAAFLRQLAQRPGRPPCIRYRSPWPRRKNLPAGAKYLLHRWLVEKEKDKGWVTALPVWLVAVDAAADPYSFRWRVIGDNVCPACGRPVGAADLERPADEERPWRIPHARCRELWARHNWRPTLFGDAAVEAV